MAAPTTCDQCFSAITAMTTASAVVVNASLNPAQQPISAAPPVTEPASTPQVSSSGSGLVEPAVLTAPNRRQIGERLYAKVAALQPALAPRITGMLLEITSAQLVVLLTNEEELKRRVDEAVELIHSQRGYVQS